MATIIGTNGNDIRTGTANTDTMVGRAGNDQLSGGSGNDRLNGGTNTDRLNGGTGIDTADYSNIVIGSTTYIGATAGVKVNLSLTGAQNTVGAGLDTLVSIENLIGTNFADTLTGNGGNNTLLGLGGNDTLNGLGGNDTLNGGDGADRLDGGAGSDTMNGGLGNDIYLVDQLSDKAVESVDNASGGVDLVQWRGIDPTTGFAESYTLGFGIENLTITGPSIGHATGNAKANVLTGNWASNILSGLDGNDTLNGLGGTDDLEGGNGNDTLNGGDNSDQLDGENGNDTLNGGEGNDGLSGGNGNDILVGGAGDDRLSGGAGADHLTSGLGSNQFSYGSVSDSPAGAGRDIIMDFASFYDDINLEGIDAITTNNLVDSFNDSFTYIGSAQFSALSSTIFLAKPGELRYDNGILQGNMDFDYAPEFEIELAGAPSLSVADLYL